MMTWVKLDDDFWRHPKTDSLHGAPFELYVCSMAYCGERLNDGFLTEADVTKLLSFRNLPRSAVDELTKCVPPDDTPFWDIVETGFHVHNYLKRNWSKEKVLAERADDARRQEEFRKRQEEKRLASLLRHSVDNSVTKPESVTNTVDNTVGHTVDNSVTENETFRHGVVNKVPYPVPVPVPVPEESVISAEITGAVAPLPEVGLRERLEARVRDAPSNRQGVLGDIYQELFGKKVDRVRMGTIVKEAGAYGTVLYAILETLNKPNRVDDPLDYVHKIIRRQKANGHANGRPVDALPAKPDYTLPPDQEAQNQRVLARLDKERAARREDASRT